MSDSNTDNCLLKDNTIKNNDYFLCPYCSIEVPAIIAISYENDEQFIEYKCKCGKFKEKIWTVAKISC